MLTISYWKDLKLESDSMETLEHIKERGLILIVPTFIAFYSLPPHHLWHVF